MITKKIKFPVQISPEFINELREKVKDYFEVNHISKYGNTNMVLKSIFMFSVYLAPLALMLTGVVTSVPAIIACWVVMGAGMAGVGMGVMHDANHGTYSKNRKINALLSKSLYVLGGYPPTWQHQHNTLHHGFTNIDGHDDDIAPLGILRFSPHKPLLKVHRYQYWYAWFFYGLMTLSWATLKDFKQLKRYKTLGTPMALNKPYKLMVTNIIVGKIIYYAVFLALPLAILPISWYWVLFLFGLMHFTCGVILGIIFQTAHVMPNTQYPMPDKDGNMENNWAIHQLLTTSDYSPRNRLFSWLIGGLNYQVEHHLFPNISHVHYRKISKFVKETAIKYGLPYNVQPTFFLALGNHARMLKYLGRKIA